MTHTGRSYTKAKPCAEGAPRGDLAIRTFGYKNHIGIGRRRGLIRTWTATDASRHDGVVLRDKQRRARRA
jgi:transposase, IS5 family